MHAEINQSPPFSLSTDASVTEFVFVGFFSCWAALLVWCVLRCWHMQSALSHLSLSGVNYKAFAACTIASFQVCLVRLISETK